MKPISEDSIFEQALVQSTDTRAAFLQTACGDDSALRRRIEALLAGADNAGEFLAQPLNARVPLLAEEKPGDTIGRYTLLEKLGAGGCGVVWRAEQREPVRRDVALKVIKLGMDTREVVARFEAERQALALMDHPGIARVFDGGATESGRPFFVMELVRGIPITKFCDEHALGLRERIELFIAVCEAVQHAHQKGIIHRDLKPSNILVVGSESESESERARAIRPSASLSPSLSLATPKVIDFGIAKATQGRLTDATLHTAVHQFIGTPAYMSPEQAELGGGADIDTRSDIYSLGVLLYELLTGETPFERGTLEHASVEEIRERIRTAEPLRPSARVRTRCRAGSPDPAVVSGAGSAGSGDPALQHAPASHAAELRGDLDWIVMRCLEKDRARRYESAAALALDLQRHLRHEPVTARPPSASYTLQKFIRRHRLAVTAATLIAGALALGVTVSTWQAIRATRAEREQSRLRKTAEQAQAAESLLRQLAETQELATRRRGYAADMNLAQQALAGGNMGRATALLDRQRPNPGEPDLRGWEWRFLWQQCRGEQTSVVGQLPGFRSDIALLNGLAASADGGWLISVGDARASLWNLRSGQRRELFPGETVNAAAMAPRSALVAVAINQGTGRPSLRLWDIAAEQVVREWPIDGHCEDVYFSEDEQTLVTAINDTRPEQTVVSFKNGSPWRFDTWRVADGQRLASCSGVAEADWPYSTVSRDLRWAAIRSRRTRVHVIELASGREQWSAIVAQEAIDRLAFSPDGKILATAEGPIDPGIRLWNVETGAPLGELSGHRSLVKALLFLPGHRLASAGDDQVIRVWDTDAHRLLRTLRGNRSAVVSLALLPDNRTLVSGTAKGRILSWDLDAPPRSSSPMSVPGLVWNWRFTADSKSLIAVTPGGEVVRRHGPAWRDQETLLNLGPIDRVLNYAGLMAREAPLLVVHRPAREVEIWDWEKRARVRVWPEPDTALSVAGFLDRGTHVLVGYEGPNAALRGLREYDLATGDTVRSWPMADADFTALKHELTADGRWWLTRSNDKSISLIDLASGQQRREKLPRPVKFGGLSPDGRLYAAMFVRDVGVWETSAFRQVTQLGDFPYGVTCVQFSPDGRRFLAGTTGAEAVQLFATDGWEHVLTLLAPVSNFYWTEFSPDGNWLGAISTFDQLYLWHAPSWAEIAAAEKEGRWR